MASDGQSAHRGLRRATRGVLIGMAVAHVLEAGVLRKRREAVSVLPSRDDTQDRGKVDVIALEGTDVDGATRGSVRAEMELRGLQVLDLIPGDLPVERWLRLLRRVDP